MLDLTGNHQDMINLMIYIALKLLLSSLVKIDETIPLLLLLLCKNKYPFEYESVQFDKYQSDYHNIL